MRTTHRDLPRHTLLPVTEDGDRFAFARIPGDESPPTRSIPSVILSLQSPARPVLPRDSVEAYVAQDRWPGMRELY